MSKFDYGDVKRACGGRAKAKAFADGGETEDWEQGLKQARLDDLQTRIHQLDPAVPDSWKQVPKNRGGKVKR